MWFAAEKKTTVNDTFHSPDSKHWAGTDGNGMGHAYKADVWRTYFTPDRVCGSHY